MEVASPEPSGTGLGSRRGRAVSLDEIPPRREPLGGVTMAGNRKPKLADALKDQQPKVDVGDRSVHPHKDPAEPDPEAIRLHNAEVAPGRDDRLVQDGRGHQTTGRM